MAEEKPDTKKLAQASPGVVIKRATSRLQSFRKQRDLTLGGTQKRTYTPTIPVRRVKEEPKDTVSEQSPKRDGGQTRQRGRGQGRGRGRGRGRGQSNIIQSKSVFSEGLAPKQGFRSSHKVGGGGGGGGSGGGGGGGEGSRSVTPKVEKDFDPDTDTSKILDMVQDDGEMKMDQDQLECGMLPIHIPLSFHDRFVKNVEDVADISSVKSESMDTDHTDGPMETAQKKPFINPLAVTSKNKTQEEQMTCARLLTGDDAKNKEQMLLFQFPDTLPTKIFENTKSDPKSNDQSPKLQDISAGYIGKIQVHKSGKTRLILGGVALDISMGTPCNFLQDVVSVHTEEGAKAMLTLGHVKHRLVCAPDFEELVNKYDGET